MFYIIDKNHWQVFNHSGFVDFDQIGKVKPFTAYITAVERAHKLSKGTVVSSREIIQILLDKNETVQILKGGMQEKRDYIQQLKDEIEFLKSENETLVSKLVSSGEEINPTKTEGEETLGWSIARNSPLPWPGIPLPENLV